MTNPLRQLEAAGQAVWLDYLHRKILENGELQRLIEDDGIKGLTSNPSIFEKAIAESDAYEGRVQAALKTTDGSLSAIYERLAIADIQDAADIFRPTWERLGGADGYVSLEVSPRLANDTEGTIADARRLWRAVDRPNLMIKVPGTPAGPPAIRRLRRSQGRGPRPWLQLRRGGGSASARRPRRTGRARATDPARASEGRRRGTA